MWADIPLFPGYEISDDGQVRNRRGKIIRPSRAPNGALQVTLRRRGRRYTRQVHPLLLRAFTGEPTYDSGFYRPKSRNGDKADTRLENWMWTDDPPWA